MTTPTKGTTILDQAMRIRYDLTAAQAKLTDLMETLATLKLDTKHRARPGSPPTLHPDACPHCEIAGGTHTTDCPTTKET